MKKKVFNEIHVNPRLKTITKAFLEKVQHKGTTCLCTTDVLHFRVALLICHYRVKWKRKKLEKGR